MTSADKPGQRTWFVGGDDEKPQTDLGGEADTLSSAQGETSLADEVFGKEEQIGDDESAAQIFSSFDTAQTPEDTEVSNDRDDAAKIETQAAANEDATDKEDTPEDGDVSPGHKGYSEGDSEDTYTTNTTEDDAHTIPAHDDDSPARSSRLFSSEDSIPLEETAAMAPVEADDDAEATDGEDTGDTSPEQARRSVVEQLNTPIADDDDELESTLVHRQSLLKDSDPSPSETEETKDAPDGSEPEWKSTAETVTKDDSKRLASSAVDEAIFEGATVRPAVPSRAGAHLWSFVLFLLLVPITWYLTWDAGTRLTMAKNAQWDTGVIDPLALSELGAGAVCLFILILVARWSSLGAFVMGIVTLGCGVPFVVLPAVTQERLEPVLESLNNAGPFTGNIAHHLNWSGGTGFFIFAGVAMIALGFVSHGARRKGRKDFLTKRRVEREKRKQGIKD